MHPPDLPERRQTLKRHDFKARSDIYDRPGVARVDLARRHIAERRMRDRVFASPALFGEPCWDILLELFLAYAEGRTTPVTSACHGSGAPVTTALRHLTSLEKSGLIVRTANASDGRSNHVWLSQRGYDRIIDYLDRIALAQPARIARLSLISAQGGHPC
jgi:hypothetical protein